MMSPEDSLAEVQDAITRCLTSQEYETPDGRKQQAALLRDLTAREEILLKRVQESDNSGRMASVVQINRPQ
jgi:hypothetical protein